MAHRYDHQAGPATPWGSRLEAACRWVDSQLAEFRIERRPEQLLPSLKAAAELAHAADFLCRSGDARFVETGTRWLEFAWGAVERGDVIEAVIKSNPRLLLAATTYVPFHLTGRSSASLAGTIAAQQVRAALTPVEWALLVPALVSLGIEADPDVAGRARRAAVLDIMPPVATMSLASAYHLLHECFYLSSWGRDKLSYSAETTAYVEAVADALLERTASAGDTDLLAEVILLRHTLPFQCAPPTAWGRLGEGQQPEGNVLPPDRAITPLDRSGNPIFARTYHTTLVSIMAWAFCHHAPAVEAAA